MLDNLKKYDVVLASNSPRRHELLKGLGVKFRIEVLGGIEETYPADMPLHDVPGHLSRLKAAAYAIRPDELLITADTVVLLDGQLLGKPADIEDACAMLGRLQGRTHEVVTGVTVTTANRQETFSVSSMVEFGPLTADEIRYYVESSLPLDKAGAYGIQEWVGYAAVKGISGSFYNVMGLPVQRLYTVLKTF